jgi:hypothetical protein
VWDWADAWILQSVVYAGKPGEIRSLIASADAINVDIPTRDQLERSVRRLEAAGLVNPEGSRVRATRTGRRLVRQSGRWRQGIREITPLLEARLKQDVPFPGHPAAWNLSQAEWEAALDRAIPPNKSEA